MSSAAPQAGQNDEHARTPVATWRGTVPRDRRKTHAVYPSGTTSMPKMVERDFSYGLAHEITRRYWMTLSADDVRGLCRHGIEQKRPGDDFPAQ